MNVFSVLSIVYEFCSEHEANLTELTNLYFPWNHKNINWFLMIQGKQKLINSLQLD